jgi:hypothetical protein
MKRVVLALVSLFVLADAFALFVWWTHPQGARKMGFSGRLPFGLDDRLPYPKAAPTPAPEPAGAGMLPVVAKGGPESPETAPEALPAVEEAAAEGPGGCRGGPECKNYCSASKHWAECLAYCSKYPEKCQSEGSPAETAVRSMERAQGLRSGVPITGVRRPGGTDGMARDPATGPGIGEGHDAGSLGGCRSMEECSDFCSKPENRRVCDAYCSKPENRQRCDQSKELLRQRGVMTGPEDGAGEE